MTVMLYKHPGHHELHGGFFDYIVVDEAEVDASIADGWSLTTDEAKIGPASKLAQTAKRPRLKKIEE